MNHNFLNKIEGRYNENLITESLAYLLSHSNNSSFQKLFYSYLYKNNVYKDSNERKFEILTQESFSNFGIPDLILQNDETIFIIEIKFWAEFSKGDQFYRYTQLLSTLVDYQKKYLVLICLKNKLNYFKSKICEQFSKDGITNEIELEEYFSSLKINPIYLLWEDILSLLSSDNILSQSIHEFISERFINLIKVDKMEIEMINTHTLPNIIQKLWAAIDQIKSILDNQNISVGRTSQSRLFYGFIIKRDWGSFWFGMYIESWLITNTPFTIQLRKEWITNDNFKEKFEKNYQEIGFIENKELGYLLPITVKEETSNLAEEIAQILYYTINKIN
jgi:hypothetical protein